MDCSKRKRFILAELNDNIPDNPQRTNTVERPYKQIRSDSEIQDIDELSITDSSGYASRISLSDSDSDEDNVTNLSVEMGAYNGDIMANLLLLEEIGLPNSDYFKNHPELSVTSRVNAAIWLMKNVEKLRYHPSTLFLAMSYLDRYLSLVKFLGPEGLPLMTAASLLLAGKMDETETPNLKEVSSLVPGGAPVEHLVVVERRMVSVLEYRLSLPTCFTFLMHIVGMMRDATTTVFLALYLLELTLIQGPPYIGIHPSLIACGSLALARSCLGINDPWSRKHQDLTLYSALNLQPVTVLLFNTLSDAETTFPNVAAKYASATFFYVSTVVPRKFLVN